MAIFLASLDCSLFTPAFSQHCNFRSALWFSTALVFWVSAWQTHVYFDVGQLESLRFSNLLDDVVDTFPENLTLVYDINTRHLAHNQHMPYYVDIPFISQWTGDDIHRSMADFFRLEFTTEENIKNLGKGNVHQTLSVVLISEKAFHTTKFGIAGIMDSVLWPTYREVMEFDQVTAGIVRTFCAKQGLEGDITFRCTKNIVRDNVLTIKEKQGAKVAALDGTLMMCLPLVFVWSVMSLVSLFFYVYIMLVLVSLYFIGNMACRSNSRPPLSFSSSAYLALYSSTPVVVLAFACSSYFAPPRFLEKDGDRVRLHFDLLLMPLFHTLWASFIWCAWVHPRPQQMYQDVAHRSRHQMHAQQMLQRTLDEARRMPAAVPPPMPMVPPPPPPLSAPLPFMPFMPAPLLPALPPMPMPAPMMPMLPMLLGQLKREGGVKARCADTEQGMETRELATQMLQQQISMVRENLLRVRQALLSEGPQKGPV
jgi:hypothetical protein